MGYFLERTPRQIVDHNDKKDNVFVAWFSSFDDHDDTVQYVEADEEPSLVVVGYFKEWDEAMKWLEGATGIITTVGPEDDDDYDPWDDFVDDDEDEADLDEYDDLPYEPLDSIFRKKGSL